jgi:hypothetical protein
VEVHIEEIAASAVVTGRILFAGNRAVQEVAHLSMSRADWEDFTRCLSPSGKGNRRRIVLKPARPEPTSAGKRELPRAHLRVLNPEREACAGAG